MAEKISTLVLKVDLDCHLCYKKIRKTLCKLQDRENIRSITYNEKNNTITISGPFDPHKLSKKLCCKARKVIKDIQIIESKEKPKDQPKPDGSKDKPKDSKDKPKESKPADKPKEKDKDKAKESKPADKPKESKPAEVKEKPKETNPAKVESDPPKTEPEQSKPKPVPVGRPEVEYVPVWPPGPVCYCRPFHESYYGGCSCGRAWGPPAVYGGPSYDGYRNYQFFCEEDQSCRIM